MPIWEFFMSPRFEFITRPGCPLCGSASCTDFISFPEIPVRLCARCGFMFSAKIMSSESLALYYSEHFGSERHLQGQIAIAKVNARLFSRLVDVRSTKTVLDVGTGYGLFLKELRDRYSINGVGIELSKQEARYGIDQLRVDVRNSSLQTAGLARDSFDVVTALEVIEHISDPPGFVSELVQYVRPSGYLIIMTDNFESEVVHALGAGFPKWIPHQHVSHFGPKTLESLVVAAGFRVTSWLSYTPWEILARYYYYCALGIKKDPNEVFDLPAVLQTEMAGTFRLFTLRRALNETYARLASRKDTKGALMYIVAQRGRRHSQHF